MMHSGAGAETESAPYLKNCWYAAAWASEVGEKLFSRRLLDEPVLFYRLKSGGAVAMGDRCPHRFAPLHLGRRVGDAVRCGYHGLLFDADGRCVNNPQAGGFIPPNTHVKAYPLVEKYGLLWIWMGNPTLAQPALVPDISFIVDEGARSSDGYLAIRANYRLATDNLMDLSHASHLHEETLGRLTPSLHTGELEVRSSGDRITAAILMPNIELPGVAARVDQWLDMIWEPPGVMVLDIGHTSAGTPRPNHGRRVIHIVTPETATTTHYFFRNAANPVGFKRDPFSEEDEPMLAACQTMMGDRDFWSMRPVVLPSDKGAIRVRRHLDKLIREEALGL